MKNSILELEKEIYQDEQFNFHAKISIIFMTNSANTFALLDPENLPTGNTAIDVWILRNQKVILSKEYDADSGLNWQFSTFETNIKTDCETPWEVSNAVCNRRMWDREVPGACKINMMFIVLWRILNGHHAYRVLELTRHIGFA